MNTTVTITWKDGTTEQIECADARVMIGVLLIMDATAKLSTHRHIPLDRLHECTIRTPL